MSVVKTASSSHAYFGESTIQFNLDKEQGLSVTIDTKRLRIRSVQSSEEERASLVDLFGDKIVMSKLLTGETRTKEKVQERTDAWLKCWKQNDPYAPLTVFRMEEAKKDVFLGVISLAHGDLPGESELSYLFMRAHWGKGYAIEAISAVVKAYALATVNEGYTLNGKPLSRIVATARIDNEPSFRILDTLGMQILDINEKYGALRYHYVIDLSDVLNPKFRDSCWMTIL